MIYCLLHQELPPHVWWQRIINSLRRVRPMRHPPATPANISYFAHIA
jgi:hypothetical protein